jgi:hypothetical protein
VNGGLSAEALLPISGISIPFLGIVKIDLVPLLLDTWNTLMPYLAHLAEVYDHIGA